MPIVIGIRMNDPTAIRAIQSFQLDVLVSRASSG